MARKARGQRGSWFADVAGERYPVAGMHRMKGLAFHNPEFTPGDSRRDAYVEALRAGRRVILAEYKTVGQKSPTFTLDENGGTTTPGGPIRERELYRVIFEVDDIVCDSEGLRFRCTNRIEQLED